MTIDKLLNCTSAELKAMSQAQLEEYFAPCLAITRPDRAAKESAAAKPKTSSAQKAMISETTDMLAALGINFKL